MQTLYDEVHDILHDMDYDTLADAADAVLEHGCQSGIVPDMVYYSDTVEFYERHKSEITKLLANLADDVGLPFTEILSDYDKDDPLSLNTHNQNLLAWFAFEETARRFSTDAE